MQTSFHRDKNIVAVNNIIENLKSVRAYLSIMCVCVCVCVRVCERARTCVLAFNQYQ